MRLGQGIYKQTLIKPVFGVILGLYRDNGQENGNYYIIEGLYRGYIGIIENKMETNI